MGPLNGRSAVIDLMSCDLKLMQLLAQLDLGQKTGRLPHVEDHGIEHPLGQHAF